MYQGAREPTVRDLALVELITQTAALVIDRERAQTALRDTVAMAGPTSPSLSRLVLSRRIQPRALIWCICTSASSILSARVISARGWAETDRPTHRRALRKSFGKGSIRNHAAHWGIIPAEWRTGSV
jgi:hypothetical protein